MLKKLFKKTFTFLLFISTILTSFHVSANCSLPAQSESLNQIFLEYLGGQTAKDKHKIAVLPFYDNVTEAADPILSYGIPFLIYDMYSEKNTISHPYFVMHHARNLGLSGSSLYDVNTIKSIASKLNAQYIVFGIIQRASPTQVRIIIDVYDAKKDTSISPASQFSVHLDDSFFAQTRQNFESAMKKARRSVKASSYPDPGFANFRYYVRGLQLSESYDMTNLNLAEAWFEKALKASFHKYDAAALGLARTHFMKSLLQKLGQQDYQPELLAGQKVLTHLRHKNKSFKYNLVDRYIHAHHAFLQAVTAFQVKNFSRAEKSAYNTLELLPEDALAEKLYFVSLQNTGHKAKRNKKHQACP